MKKVSTNNKQNTKAQKKSIYGKRINLLVDIEKNIKAQKLKRYEQALVRSNINTLVKTMNFLIDHKITTSEDFQNYLDRKTSEYAFCQKDIKKIDNELLALSEKIKFTQNYKKNAVVYYESKRAKNPREYAREHESQIVLFKASEIYFERMKLNPKEINLSELFEQYKMLIKEKQQLFKVSRSLSAEINEIDRVAENIEKALGINLGESENNSAQQDSTREKNNSDRQQ